MGRLGTDGTVAASSDEETCLHPEPLPHPERKTSDMTPTTSPHRARMIDDGAKAARDGIHRSENPHPVAGEDWTNWMDGFDHQTVWLEHGRGVYEPFADADRPSS